MKIYLRPRPLLACTVALSLFYLLLPTAASGQTPPTFSISDTSIVEGNSGNVVAQLTVTRTGSTNQSSTVEFMTSDETASFNGGDYYQTSGTLAFNAGVTTQTILVNVIGDTVDEPDETFLVTLSNPTNATISDAVGRVTITDDDAPVIVSISDVTVTEGDSGTVPAIFTVTLSRPVSAGVSINYTTVQGTAIPGDYAHSSGSLFFSPGQTTRTVSVPVAGDTVDESDETFSMELSNPIGVVIGDGTGVGTIIDNDTASGGGGGGGGGGGSTSPTVSISDATLTEGNSGTTSMVFTVTMSSASTGPVEVDYETFSGTATAGQDFTAAAGRLTFAPGETVKQISVSIIGDALDENDETFQVFFSRVGGATFGDPNATGTIQDDDGSPVLTVADVEIVEGDTGTSSIDLTLQLSSASSGFVSVDITTADGTAMFDDADYYSTSGTIVFNPGVTTRTVSLTVVGDTKVEPDEHFTVELSDLQGAAATDLSARVDIRTDDVEIVDSTTTLIVAKKGGLLIARGKVVPQVAGSVSVTLLKKRDGAFRRIRTEQVTLVEKTNNAGVEISSYRTTFSRPSAGRCRIIVAFAGNAQVGPSRARSTFSC